MCAYRSRGDYHQRPYPSRPRDDFYDERRSRSRSPNNRSSSPYRRSPPHDIPRGPAQRSARDHHRDGRAGSPRGYRNRSHDRRDHRAHRYSQSPRRGRSEYDDRDRTNRTRSRSMSRDSYGDRPSSRGRPSKEVMLEGLAPHLTENDISTELQQHYHVTKLEDVRIIRDRQTRQSRQFGFLRFPTLEAAEAFMDVNYPSIYLYGQGKGAASSEDAKVRIAYGKERKETRPDEDDWTCKICNVNNYSTRVRCFRCQTLKPEQASVAKTSNAGDNDAAPDNTPSQFLLLRGLEPSVSEELFAKGVAKLNKPSGSQSHASQSAQKKGAKVASTTGDTNLGAREGSLRRVLLVRDRKTNESWRYGFAEYASIDEAQAAVTRFNSFDRFTIASRQVMISYIHAGVFIPVLNPSPSTERFTFSPLANPAMRLAYWDEEAYVTELVVSAPGTGPSVGQPTPQTDVDGTKTKDGDKTKKRKAQEAPPPTAKKAAPSHLQFWSNRHAELHGIKSKTDDNGSEQAGDDSTIPPAKSYADPLRNCCYLCMRQFTSAAEVNKHERLSDLHRQNLKNEVKLKRAEHKLEKHGVAEQKGLGGSAGEYRDRARERRKIYGVVNKKGEQINPNHKPNKSSAGSDSDDQPAAPVQSKGAALLSKMGYTAGSGLGASGEGITAPISQDIYVAGVGLGAQGGKVGDAVAEAERNTKGDYGAFAARTKEGARERYAQLGK